MVLNAAVTSKLCVEILDIGIGFDEGSSFCTPLDLLPHLRGSIDSLGHLHILFHHEFKKDKLQKFVNFFPNLWSLSLEVDGHSEEEFSVSMKRTQRTPKCSFSSSCS
jgi:hypothetical protein